MSKPEHVILALTLMLFAQIVPAAPAINTLSGGLFDRDTGVAVRGYDVVAYFLDGKAVEGQKQFVTQWMGATWQFASNEHLQAFLENPTQYAPQYGGYCAYGVAQNKLVSIEPDKFKVLDGKLYLNYDGDVQAKWLLDPAGYIKTADSQFPALVKK